MAFALKAAVPEEASSKPFWQRPEPRRLITLAWPALCAWALAAFYFTVAIGFWQQEVSPFWIEPPLIWVMLGVGIGATVSCWVAMGWAVVALVSRAPVGIRVLAAALNASPFVAALTGLFFPLWPQ